jgi:type II secretory pathway pseudopilin PulG
MYFAKKTPPRTKRAFSLVEVVLSLAIVVFALFSMVGLLSVGLQSTQDSRERIQAATIAEQICATRRAAPTNAFPLASGPQPGFPLPPLQTATNNLTTPAYITRDGVLTNQANADFGFIYNITPKLDAVPAGNTSNGVSQVYMAFFWPALASPTSAATGHYEVNTTFGLQ